MTPYMIIDEHRRPVRSSRAHYTKHCVAVTRAFSLLAFSTLALIVAFCQPFPTGAQTTPDSLHDAAARGDLDAIRALLDHGADVNGRNSFSGGTPLHAAIAPKLRPGLLKPTVELLLARGANLEVKDNYGRTPLYAAAEDSTVEAVELLLSRGANVNARNRAQQTPLHAVVAKPWHDKREIVALLLTKHPDVNAKNVVGYTPLHLLAKMRLGLTSDEVRGTTHPAAADARRLLQDQVEAARLLIAGGAIVDARDDDNSTPLHWAAWSNSEAVAELILRSGADKNTRDKFGRTPLHKAAEEGSLEVTELLVRAGADLAARDDLNRTPLESALRYGKQAVADYLRAHGPTE
jgi:ankyrin repeat protein